MVWIFVVPEKSVAYVRLNVCRSAWNVPPARFAIAGRCAASAGQAFSPVRKNQLATGILPGGWRSQAIRSRGIGIDGCASVSGAS